MSMFEKVMILGSLGAVGAVSVYTIFGPSKTTLSKEDIQKKRERVLQAPDMRILYSTMTFFYLQGFKQEKPDSFFLLHDILQISQPKYVAMQLSEKDYEQDYQSVLKHPRFPETMNRLDVILKTKDIEKLEQMDKEIELKNLEKLYLFDYCKKKKCQILFADKSQTEYDRQFEAKLRLKKLANEKQSEIPTQLADIYQDQMSEEQLESNKHSIEEIKKMSEEEIKKEIYTNQKEKFYVDRIMEELKPKYSLLPQNPYKTIIGIVEPEHVNSIAAKWKQQFKSVYGHEIIEDESVEGKFQ